MLKRTLIILGSLLVLIGIGTGCKPHEIHWYLHEATPEQREAVDNGIRANAAAEASLDCYTAQRIYFPEVSESWARMIIDRESKNRPNAANSASTARGCWQLLLSYHAWRYYEVGCTPLFWADARCNTLAARHLYLEQGTSPWNL